MIDFEMIAFAHRPHPDQTRLAASLMVTVPSTVRLTVMREPGTAHQNMARALDMARERYLFLLDEDVEFLQQGWHAPLLAVIKGRGDAGLVGCAEVKDPEGRQKALAIEAGAGPVVSVHMTPAFVWLIDRQRTAGIRIDADMPGLKGMSDNAFCTEIRLRGLKVYRHDGVIVYHPHKSAVDAERAAAGYTTLAEEKGWWNAQVERMNAHFGVGKW